MLFIHDQQKIAATFANLSRFKLPNKGNRFRLFYKKRGRIKALPRCLVLPLRVTLLPTYGGRHTSWAIQCFLDKKKNRGCLYVVGNLTGPHRYK